MLDMYLFKLTEKLNQNERDFFQVLSEPTVTLHKAEGTTDKDFFKFLFSDNIIKIAETNANFKAQLKDNVKQVRSAISRLLAENPNFKSLECLGITEWRGHPDLHGYMQSLYKKSGGQHIFNKESIFLSKEDCISIVDLANRWLNQLDIEGDPVKAEPVEVDKVVQTKEQLDAQVMGLCRDEAKRIAEYEKELKDNPPKEGELRHTDGYFFDKSNKSDWQKTIEVFQELINTFDFEHETLVYKASF